MTARIARLQRFPIKGFSAEALEEVNLTPGEGVPGDRLFGFARHGSGFDPKAPQPLPKDRFVVLLTQAALAGLRTRLDGQTFTIEAPDGLHRFEMANSADRADAARWIAAYLDLGDPEPPTYVSAAPHRFTDVSVVSPQLMNAISILNLASVRDLEQRLQVPIDPARFRANIELDGLPAWWELENIDAPIRAGDVTLRLIMRTKRCAATEVNPETAERDLKLPYLLRKELGHMDMGVYVEVETGGRLQPGLQVTAG
ncbi:MOSC domain-containing protein [Thalassococcus sp. S3]|uniref:MOSC domain-containing protein n=1 Tax=Thalassococcus sp. S3 TaxID=2017482 RepID=UPI0010240252|nr:MOSC domain-containing protein [Thalassococcus sp. S3]QBF33035.1 MOSC domain-containing protein [Thalassococcus sp. S3]